MDLEIPPHKLRFQFISEPTDINFGGKVHGGVVMKWLDQTAYACASCWAETYCVTVYVGGIRFYKPIAIGEIVRIDAKVIMTGRTSIHIAVDVYGKTLQSRTFEKKTHCIIVFVSVDNDGNPIPVRRWVPTTPEEKNLEGYAMTLKDLRRSIEEEMVKYM